VYRLWVVLPWVPAAMWQGSCWLPCHDAGLRAALNIRYSEDVLEVVRDMGLVVEIEKLLGEGDG